MTEKSDFQPASARQFTHPRLALLERIAQFCQLGDHRFGKGLVDLRRRHLIVADEKGDVSHVLGVRLGGSTQPPFHGRVE